MIGLLTTAMLAAPHPAPSVAVRSRGDLAPCPGMAMRRPPGTNCYGIEPSACGADLARGFRGRFASADIRSRLERAVGHTRIRWVRPGQPVIQDLRVDRLNVMLDARGRIAKVDCF